MTRRRDFKRRVRERQAHTGETYTAARRALVEHREPLSVIESVDLTPLAKELGLRCGVSMFPELVARIEPRVALERLRDALLATLDDPAMWLFRAVILAGQRPRLLRSPRIEDVRRVQQFMARARSGLAGIDDTGTVLALQIDSVAILCSLALGTPLLDRPPLLLLMSTPPDPLAVVLRAIPY